MPSVVYANLATPLRDYATANQERLRKLAMGIKLNYHHPLSTFSRRVLIAFAEKQIPHELTVVDMAARVPVVRGPGRHINYRGSF
jgi:hypothetical protein